MSHVQDKIKDIVAQLQRLQIQELELLQRLERLREADDNASEPPIRTRKFVIGDLVQIKNPRPLQSKKGTIIRIGIDTGHYSPTNKASGKIRYGRQRYCHYLSY
jgi:hypothetical protein